MSNETFPCPIRVTCSVLCSGGGGGLDGCRVYQWTTDRAGMHTSDTGRAGCSFGIPQPVAKTMWEYVLCRDESGMLRIFGIPFFSDEYVMFVPPKNLKRGSEATESNL